jgi:hypothetical protein
MEDNDIVNTVNIVSGPLRSSILCRGASAHHVFTTILLVARLFAGSVPAIGILFSHGLHDAMHLGYSFFSV